MKINIPRLARFRNVPTVKTFFLTQGEFHVLDRFIMFSPPSVSTGVSPEMASGDSRIGPRVPFIFEEDPVDE